MTHAIKVSNSEFHVNIKGKEAAIKFMANIINESKYNQEIEFIVPYTLPHQFIKITVLFKGKEKSAKIFNKEFLIEFDNKTTEGYFLVRAYQEGGMKTILNLTNFHPNDEIFVTLNLKASLLNFEEFLYFSIPILRKSNIWYTNYSVFVTILENRKFIPQVQLEYNGEDHSKDITNNYMCFEISDISFDHQLQLKIYNNNIKLAPIHTIKKACDIIFCIDSSIFPMESLSKDIKKFLKNYGENFRFNLVRFGKKSDLFKESMELKSDELIDELEKFLDKEPAPKPLNFRNLYHMLFDDFKPKQKSLFCDCFQPVEEDAPCIKINLIDLQNTAVIAIGSISNDEIIITRKVQTFCIDPLKNFDTQLFARNNNFTFIPYSTISKSLDSVTGVLRHEAEVIIEEDESHQQTHNNQLLIRKKNKKANQDTNFKLNNIYTHQFSTMLNILYILMHSTNKDSKNEKINQETNFKSNNISIKQFCTMLNIFNKSKYSTNKDSKDEKINQETKFKLNNISTHQCWMMLNDIFNLKYSTNKDSKYEERFPYNPIRILPFTITINSSVFRNNSKRIAPIPVYVEFFNTNNLMFLRNEFQIPATICPNKNETKSKIYIILKIEGNKSLKFDLEKRNYYIDGEVNLIDQGVDPAKYQSRGGKIDIPEYIIFVDVDNSASDAISQKKRQNYIILNQEQNQDEKARNLFDVVSSDDFGKNDTNKFPALETLFISFNQSSSDNLSTGYSSNIIQTNRYNESTIPLKPSPIDNHNARLGNSFKIQKPVSFDYCCPSSDEIITRPQVEPTKSKTDKVEKSATNNQHREQISNLFSTYSSDLRKYLEPAIDNEPMDFIQI